MFRTQDSRAVMPPAAQTLASFNKLQKTKFASSIDNTEEEGLSDEEEGLRIQAHKLVKLTERANVATEAKAIQDVVIGVQKASKLVEPKSLVTALNLEQFNESRSRIRNLIDSEPQLSALELPYANSKTLDVVPERHPQGPMTERVQSTGTKVSRVTLGSGSNELGRLSLKEKLARKSFASGEF